MSDQDAAPGEEEDEDRVRPRHQSAAERRSSETVMLDSDNLGDLVSQAKGSEPAVPQAAAAPTAPAPASSSASETDEDAESTRSIILIVGVAVIIVLAGLVYFIRYYS